MVNRTKPKEDNEMGKYYDKLVRMNEALDKELGITKENVDPDSEIAKKLRKSGLQVSYNSKGLEVSYADKDEQESKDIFERLCAASGVYDLVENVTTEKMLGGMYLTYGNISEELLTENENNGENTIEISTDSLTDDQKEEILLDKGIDKKTLDKLKDPKKLDGALTAVAADDVKQESGAVPLAGFIRKLGADKGVCESKLDDSDVSEEVVIRMDDNDLDMHGFVKAYDGKDIELVDDESDAEVFQHEELGQNKIEAICTKFHYDPSTFTIKSVDPRADEPYEDDDDFGENWVSLDPMNPQATTLP